MRIFNNLKMEEAPSGEENSGDGAVALNSDNWKDFVSEDLRSNSSLDKFTSLDGLAKSYLNAESMIQKDKMIIPKTDEEFADAYSRLGRPESSDGYELTYPEGYDGKGDLDIGFKNAAFEAGLNQSQISKLHEWYGKATGDLQSNFDAKQEQAFNEAESNLKGEWGEKYNSNVEIANRAITEHGDDALSLALNESGMSNNPAMIKFLHKIGSLSSEDNMESGNGEAAATPDQLQEEINSLMASNSYQDKADPSHSISVKKVQGLFQRLHAA